VKETEKKKEKEKVASVLSEQEKAVNSAIQAESRDHLKAVVRWVKEDASSASVMAVLDAAVDTLRCCRSNSPSRRRR
jgi:hypothetical protein